MALQQIHSRENPPAQKNVGMSDEDEDHDFPGEVSDEYQDGGKNKPDV
jgi:hypothetical protein